MLREDIAGEGERYPKGLCHESAQKEAFIRAEQNPEHFYLKELVDIGTKYIIILVRSSLYHQYLGIISKLKEDLLRP